MNQSPPPKQSKTATLCQALLLIAFPITVVALIWPQGHKYDINDNHLRMQEQSNLRLIYQAYLGYEIDNSDNPPPNLAALLEQGYLTDENYTQAQELLFCPHDQIKLPANFSKLTTAQKQSLLNQSSFRFPLLNKALSKIDNAHQIIFAYCANKNHAPYINTENHSHVSVVFADGHFEFLTPEELKQYLDNQNQTQTPPAPSPQGKP